MIENFLLEYLNLYYVDPEQKNLNVGWVIRKGLQKFYISYFFNDDGVSFSFPQSKL